MSSLAGVYAGARAHPLKGEGKIKYLPMPLPFGGRSFGGVYLQVCGALFGTHSFSSFRRWVQIKTRILRSKEVQDET